MKFFREIRTATAIAMMMPACGLAQTSIGGYAGVQTSTLPYLSPQGVSLGVFASHILAEHWSGAFFAGAMLTSFRGGEYRLLPPADNRTFHSLMIPVELLMRYRTGSHSDGGSFIVQGGVSGTYIDRDAVTVTDIYDGAVSTIPGFRGFTAGIEAGIGFETGTFIADKGRIVGDWVYSKGLSGEEKVSFIHARLGVSVML